MSWIDFYFFYTEVLPECNDTPICGLHAHIWACPKAQGPLCLFSTEVTVYSTKVNCIQY